MSSEEVIRGAPPPMAVLVVAMAISLGVVVPLTGVLVRFRANYNPKALRLDSEGGAAAHTGPIVNSYLQMFARVQHIEGISGLYKGLMPTAISTVLVSIVILLAVDTEHPRHGKYRAPETGVLGTLFYSLAMLVISLPTSILTYRAITTPKKLSYFDLMGSLRALLTPTECRRPWILYLTPGPLRRLLLPKASQPILGPSDISLWKLAIYLVFLFTSVLVLTPLEVIATRLAIQRNHASAEYNSVSQEVDGNNAEDAAEYSGAEEDVIGLRHEGDPYLGLADCAKRIIDEEGIMTLYRAWWITLLGGLASTFA